MSPDVFAYDAALPYVTDALDGLAAQGHTTDEVALLAGCSGSHLRNLRRPEGKPLRPTQVAGLASVFGLDPDERRQLLLLARRDLPDADRAAIDDAIRAERARRAAVAHRLPQPRPPLPPVAPSLAALLPVLRAAGHLTPSDVARATRWPLSLCRRVCAEPAAYAPPAPWRRLAAPDAHRLALLWLTRCVHRLGPGARAAQAAVGWAPLSALGPLRALAADWVERTARAADRTSAGPRRAVQIGARVWPLSRSICVSAEPGVQTPMRSEAAPDETPTSHQTLVYLYDDLASWLDATLTAASAARRARTARWHARQLRLPVATLADLRRGHTRPSLAVADRLADLFDLDPDEAAYLRTLAALDCARDAHDAALLRDERARRRRDAGLLAPRPGGGWKPVAPRLEAPTDPRDAGLAPLYVDLAALAARHADGGSLAVAALDAEGTAAAFASVEAFNLAFAAAVERAQSADPSGPRIALALLHDVTPWSSLPRHT